jgi:hypothetical protein
VRAVFAVTLLVASTGCVSHYSTVELWPQLGRDDRTYTSVGKVRVPEFQDRRGSPKESPGETVATAPPGAEPEPTSPLQMETKPPAPFFLRKLMIEEAGPTGIFTVDESAALALQVDLLSLQSDLLYSPLMVLCPISTLAVAISAYAQSMTPLAYTGAAWVLSCVLEFPAVRAEVRYRASLAREGEIVFTTEIRERCSEHFWLLGQVFSYGNVAQTLTSQCMTRSVQTLFEQLSRAPLKASGAAPDRVEPGLGALPGSR